MLLLLGLHLGDDIAVREAGMELVGPDGRRLSAIPDERLADLEERGFVTIGEAGPAVTPSGRWWCRRWVDWVRGPGTFASLKRMASSAGSKPVSVIQGAARAATCV
jgi:hypothetical protein